MSDFTCKSVDVRVGAWFSLGLGLGGGGCGESVVPSLLLSLVCIDKQLPSVIAFTEFLAGVGDNRLSADKLFEVDSDFIADFERKEFVFVGLLRDALSSISSINLL